MIRGRFYREHSPSQGMGGSTRDQFEVKEAIVRSRSLPLTAALLTGLRLNPGRACVLIHKAHILGGLMEKQLTL